MTRLFLGLCFIVFCSTGFAGNRAIPNNLDELSSTVKSLQLNQADCNYEFLRILRNKTNELDNEKRPASVKVELANCAILVGNQIRNCRRNKLLN